MRDENSLKRIFAPRHHIDAGFINRRKCFSIFGRPYVKMFEAKRYPGDDHCSVLMNDHLMIHLALEACNTLLVPSLAECLQAPQERQLFCSTENVEGCGDVVYSVPRVSNRISLPFECTREVFLEYHTSHIYADTQRMLMGEGQNMALVAELFEVEENKIIAHPLIMGPPTYDHPDNSDAPFDFTFDGWTQYEIHPQDIDQFSKCGDVDVTTDEWITVMESLPENDVKARFCRLLADSSSKDWGGEQYDHYTADLSLNGARKSGAFLFKGPSAWGEMKPKHLGKNGDQIFSLATIPS